MSRAADVAAVFDREAEWYDRVHDAQRIEGHALRSRQRALVAAVGPGPGRLLDAGMGPGRLLAELAAAGWDVSGVDISARMVERARARLPQAELVEGSIEALPFADASFDVAVASGVLEFVDEPARAVAELARVLRPGGRLVGSIPNPSALDMLAKRVYYPVVRVAKRYIHSERPAPAVRGFVGVTGLRALLVDAGLVLGPLVHTSFAPIPTPLDRLAPGPDVRLAELLERRAPRLGSVLGAQIVFSAEKPA